jgi:hypothetical protein
MFVITLKYSSWLRSLSASSYPDEVQKDMETLQLNEAIVILTTAAQRSATLSCEAERRTFSYMVGFLISPPAPNYNDRIGGSSWQSTLPFKSDGRTISSQAETHFGTICNKAHLSGGESGCGCAATDRETSSVERRIWVGSLKISTDESI